MIQVNRGLQNEYVGCLYSFEYYPCDPSVRERYYAEITAIREQCLRFSKRESSRRRQTWIVTAFVSVTQEAPL